MRSYVEGKIYELKVAGELLGGEFDVYTPFVDSGVGMIAIHRVSKKIFFIQVKKAKYNVMRGRWDFRNIPLREVEELETVSRGHGAFFVFVLERPDKTDSFLVLPSNFIKKHKEDLYPVNSPVFSDKKEQFEGVLFIPEHMIKDVLFEEA